MTAKTEKIVQAIVKYNSGKPPKCVIGDKQYYSLLNIAIGDGIIIGKAYKNNIAAINIMVSLLIDGYIYERERRY